MKRTPLFLLFLALYSQSCSDKKEEEIAQSLVREIPVENEQKASLLVKQAALKCSGECPENVGLYLATRPTSVLTCTAFLIESDVIATNSHCLPKVVKDLPDLCPSTIQVLLPASADHPEERVSCKELLGFSERPNAISPDLALIKIEKTSRKPILVSRSGISTQTHFAWKVNPGKGASGDLVKQECKLVAKNYRLPLFENRNSKVFVTGDCPSLPGNSGAPLINGEGAAVGIFQAELPFSEMQLKAWSKHLLPGETFAPLAMGTNLICLKQNDKFVWNPYCDPIDDEAIERPRISHFNFEQEKSQELEQLDSQFFSWQTVEKAKTLEKEVRLEPKCLKQTLSEELEFVTPILQAKIYFNRYMQIFPKFEKIGEEKVLYSILETQNGWQLLSPQKETREISFCEIDPIEP